MRIVFLGSGEFGLPTLRRLAAVHTLAAIVSQPDRPAGRKRRLTPTPIAEYAQQHDLPLLRGEDVNTPDCVQRIADLAPSAGVVIAFGQKLSPELIHAMGALAVNLHGSLLPRYRGAAPVHRAMMQGEHETGISVIGLAQRMDAGAIYAQRSTLIGPLETAGELHDRLADLGPEAVEAVLDDLLHDRLTPLPQDDTQATKAPKLSKPDGTTPFYIDARSVRCRVHGLTPWPGCRVRWTPSDEGEPRELILRRVADDPQREQHEAHAPPGTVLDDLRIACGTGIGGGALRLLELQAPGGRAMDAAPFAHGHGLHVGDHLEPMPAP